MSPQFLKVYYKQNPLSEEIESVWHFCFLFLKFMNFNFKYLFAPLSFYENYKMIFSNSYIVPENIAHTKNGQRKITLLKIIEESFDMRSGPALIFFEVNYY